MLVLALYSAIFYKATQSFRGPSAFFKRLQPQEKQQQTRSISVSHRNRFGLNDSPYLKNSLNHFPESFMRRSCVLKST